MNYDVITLVTNEKGYTDVKEHFPNMRDAKQYLKQLNHDTYTVYLYRYYQTKFEELVEFIEPNKVNK